jgi:hypothetical protein
MRLVDAQYSQRFFNSTFHDSYEFYYFSKELNDPEFSNNQVWRAWRYIRPLVTKYVPESEDKLLEKIRELDYGYGCDFFAILFRISLILGRPPKATAEKARPTRTVSKHQWDRIARQSKQSLNVLLDEASKGCGYKQECRGSWEYANVFPKQVTTRLKVNSFDMSIQCLHF